MANETPELAGLEAARDAWQLHLDAVATLPPASMPHPSVDPGAWLLLADAIVAALESGDEARIESAMRCLRESAFDVDAPAQLEAGFVRLITWDLYWLTAIVRYGWAFCRHDGLPLDLYARWFDTTPSRVLIAGGGPDPLAEALAWLGHEVTLLDSSRLAVAVLRARPARHHRHDDFVRRIGQQADDAQMRHRPGGTLALLHGDLMHACDAPGPFDAIICSHVLNNKPLDTMLDAAIEALIQRLGPEGCLVIGHPITVGSSDFHDLLDRLLAHGLADTRRWVEPGTPLGRRFALIPCPR